MSQDADSRKFLAFLPPEQTINDRGLLSADMGDSTEGVRVPPPDNRAHHL